MEEQALSQPPPAPEPYDETKCIDYEEDRRLQEIELEQEYAEGGFFYAPDDDDDDLESGSISGGASLASLRQASKGLRSR